MAGIWTRNYYNLLTAYAYGQTTVSSTATPTDYTPPIRIRKPNGSYSSTGVENFGNFPSSTLIGPGAIGKRRVELFNGSNISAYNNIAIAFGTGSTPASYEDYNVEGRISSGLSLGSQDGTLDTPSTYDSDTHIYKSQRSFVVTNIGSSTLNVGNFGIYVPAEGVTAPSSVVALVYHETFDNVVALAPGESFIITFTLSGEIYNYNPY